MSLRRAIIHRVVFLICEPHCQHTFLLQGPGGHILKHVDMGGWAVKLHRVHVPIITNPDVRGSTRNVLSSAALTVLRKLH